MALLIDPIIRDQASVQRNFDQLARIIHTGRGSPEGVVKADRAIYIREDGAPGSTFYVKRTGADVATGWLAVA